MVVGTYDKQVKTILQSRLLVLPLIGLDDQLSSLYNILYESVSKGQSNSILLQGPTGCGKTRAMEQSLQKLRDGGALFHKICLDGIDSKIALQAITRQLGIEQEGEDVVGNMSFADRLQFLLATLASGGIESTPVVFMLKDMDLFCAHSNQILLYNLFDIAQKSMTPICVVGITGRLNTLNLLEKRVKSRFSHRVIDFYPPKTLEIFREIAHSAFTLLESDPIPTHYAEEFNRRSVKAFDSVQAKEVIEELYALSRHVPTLLLQCSASIQKLSEKESYISINAFVEQNSISATNQRTLVFDELSILELCIVTAIKKFIQMRVTTKEPNPDFNFEIIYDIYHNYVTEVARRGNGVGNLNFTKPVALKAYEQMVENGTIRFHEGVAALAPKGYRLARCMISLDAMDSKLKSIKGLPSELSKWIKTN